MPLTCCCCDDSASNYNEELIPSLKMAPETSNNDNKMPPFYTDLPKDFGLGKRVSLQIVAHPICSRFAVNFNCGRSPDSDIAFHLNPRLALRHIVRNSLIKNKWGIEEISTIAKLPSFETRIFPIEIFVGDNEFYVSINGRFLCQFNFRVPFSRITGIEVVGEVDVFHALFETIECFPEDKTFMAIAEKENDDNIVGEQILKPELTTPLTYLLAEGLQLDWELEIRGRIKLLPHSFHVNLQQGPQQWPAPIIAMHLNPRFDSAEHNNWVLVINSWSNGVWNKEERTPLSQFLPGMKFTLNIRPMLDNYSIWVNGTIIGEFKFRTNTKLVDSVKIGGDVVIYSVRISKLLKNRALYI